MKQVNDASVGREAPEGCGGWLALLCALLVIWHPLRVGTAAAMVVSSLPIRGPVATLTFLARIAITAVGVGAGMALAGRKPGAVAFAKYALTASAAIELFVYLTPYLPSNRAPGEAPYWLGAWALYYTGWLAYLSRSRRVRRTFG